MIHFIGVSNPIHPIMINEDNEMVINGPAYHVITVLISYGPPHDKTYLPGGGGGIRLCVCTGWSAALLFANH